MVVKAATFFFYLLCLISWLSTGTGLYALTDMLIFSYVVSACIQGVLAIAIYTFFSVDDFFKKIFTFMGYTLTTILSVMFSISFWFSIFSAEEYAHTIFDHQFKQVQQEALILYSQYEQQNNALTSLAKKAEKIAFNEGKKGGTCKGGSKAGAGSLYSKRMFQAEQFRALANRFNAPMSAMKATLNSIKQVKTSDIPVAMKLSKLDDNLSKIKSIYQSRNSDYKTELNNHLKWEKKGYPSGSIYMGHNFSGSKYACSEVSITSPIKSIVNRAEKEMPEISVEVFNPDDRSAVVKKIATAIFDFFYSSPKAKIEDQENVFGKQYILPIFMGLFVDLLILFLSYLLNSWNERRKGITPGDGGEHNIHDLWKLYSESIGTVRSAAAALPDRFEFGNSNRRSVGEAAQYLEDLLNRVTIDINGSRYFLIPIENEKRFCIKTSAAKTHTEFISQIKEVFGMSELVGYYGKKGSSEYFKGYDIAEIAACYGYATGDLDEECSFSVFRLDDKVMKMIRDYSADIDFYFDEDVTWFISHNGQLDIAKWQSITPSRQITICANFVRDNATVHQNKDGSKEWHLKISRTDAGKPSLENIIASWLRDDDCGLGEPHVIEKNISLGFTSIPYPFLHVFVITQEGWERIRHCSEVANQDQQGNEEEMNYDKDIDA